MDYSLLFSFFALLISTFVAGWMVYRDIIQKPKFRVSISVKNILQQGQEPIGPDVYVEALNMGPLPNRIGLVFGKPSWWDRRIMQKKYGMIMSDYNHQGNDAKGQRVEVGDTVTFVFPINQLSLGLDQFLKIGVSDGYGRKHWASKKKFAKVKAQIKETLEKKQARVNPL